jgi:pimeloyl-ACP methyl ester carboxylesterase
MRKTITFDDLTLSYLEKNETAEQTLFFIHGNSSSATFWKPQFDDPAFDSYRLVAFDLPAHGQSSADPLHNYGVKDLGRTLAKAVKQLAVNGNYMLVAISLGTNIVAEMLDDSIHPAAIVLAGPTILGDEYSLENIGLPALDPGVLFTDDAPLCAVSNYYKEVLHSRCEQMAAELTSRHLDVKIPFRSTLINRAIEGQVSNELELLRKKEVPLLIVFGKEERSINPDYLDKACLPIWNTTIYKIPGAGHLVSLEQPRAFNDLLLAYTQDRFTKSPSSGRSKSVPMHS